MKELRHELLEDAGVRHGFGTRSSTPHPGVIRPTQVHGTAVAGLSGGGCRPADADAIVAGRGEAPVGILTADCVPILAAAEDGSAVAAIHAGWRGLAAGVVEAGVRALAARSTQGAPLRAVVGPCIGPCCYEVDAPVIDPLRARFGNALDAATLQLEGQEPGRWMIDLGFLALVELDRCGFETERRARLPDSCTMCEGDFHSFRRDGPAAGRLLHWVEAPRVGAS